jgi:hypothetical protein
MRRALAAIAATTDGESCEPDSMIDGSSDGSPLCTEPYRRAMKTHDVAPRNATTDRSGIRREGRPVSHRSLAAAVAGVAVAIAIAACSPSASTVPAGSVALPSVDVSAAASAASGAALAALDQIDGVVAASQTSGKMTSADASSITTLTSGIRTSLQTGDITAARTAVDELSTKADAVAAQLTDPTTAAQLKAAVAALKAAIPAS